MAHGQKSKYTPEILNKAEAMLREGLPYRRVAKILGLTDTHLAMKLPGYGKQSTKYGPNYKQFHIPEDKRPEVEAMLVEGYSAAEVSRKTGVNVGHIRIRYPEALYSATESAYVGHLIRYGTIRPKD